MGGEAFRTFLSDWRAVLQVRLDEAVDRITSIPSVLGVVIGGSVGGGAPWPLSDIDLLPVFKDGEAAAGRHAVEGVRQSLLTRWAAEGVRTPLDVGWLCFERREVEAALADPPAALVGRCDDARWLHSADKAFGGQGAGAGAGGQLAVGLAAWFTEARFLPTVVADRTRRALEARERAWCALWAMLSSGDAAEGAASRLAAFGGATLGWVLATWGVRDCSYARILTRFERAAQVRGRTDLVAALHAVFDLDVDQCLARLAAAPAWLRERAVRQLAARAAVRDGVTAEGNGRDVLYVFSNQERRHGTAPFASWVGLDAPLSLTTRRARRLWQVIQALESGDPPARPSPALTSGGGGAVGAMPP